MRRLLLLRLFLPLLEAVQQSEAYILFYERRQSSQHMQHRERVVAAINEHKERRQSALDKGEELDEMLLSRGWFARYVATDSPVSVRSVPFPPPAI